MNVKQGFNALAEAEAIWKKSVLQQAAMEKRLHKARETNAHFAAHDLERLLCIVTGEERSYHKKWQSCQQSLMSATNPERYSLEALAYLSFEGVIAIGHHIWLTDEETGETDAIEVTQTDSPINRAVINQRIGTVVQVMAPGGLFNYRISQIAATKQSVE